MQKFEGIPAGRIGVTPLPNVIVSELLPLMDDAAEIKIVLHVFYLLTQKKGSPRWVTFDELRGDTTLMRSLDFKPENLKRGLEKATKHCALIQIETDGAARYFFNTAESRKAVEKIEQGEIKLGENVRVVEAAPEPTPNIFKLYEQNIGMLTPMIADELKEAEQEFPPEVILDAFRIAAENNKRTWSYVRGVLRNWARENRHEKTRRPASRERRPTVTGKLADVARSK